MSLSFSHLQASAIDGRCHNIYFRQDQLKCLHDVLRKDSNVIQDAIQKDGYVSRIESATEFALAVSIVKEHYTSLDPEKELEAEYRISNGTDAPERQEPEGIVFIEPQSMHTPFFSIIAPLSAALAAGNCVVLRLDNSLHAITSLLRSLLTQALDSNVFAITSSNPSQDFLLSCIQVHQQTSIDSPTYSQLASRSDGRVMAVVDRTADLAAAAKDLVTARFAFGGTSPYAPDLVLVNEFVKKEFLEHVLRFAIPFLAGHGVANGGVTEKGNTATTKKTQERRGRIQEVLTYLSENKKRELNVVTRGDSGAVVELTNPSLSSKIHEPIFYITTITSLDNAIDTIGIENHDSALLAAYHFAAPKHGKYLAQFIKSDVSFINHVPVSLLLGPAAPAFQHFNLESRYDASHFTRALPQFITPPPRQSLLASIVTNRGSRDELGKLVEDATREMKIAKRPESIATGFFEQGVFMGLGIYGIPLLTGIGAGAWYAVRAFMRNWKY